MSFFREIKERNVLQALGVYIGAVWVLVEILDRLVERYLLSPILTDVVFWGLFSLLPAVILIAYVHGKPGKDEITRSEIVGVPINLIATTGLLFTLFSGEYIGATADRISVMGEDGQMVETYIPKADFRHSMMMFFWENESGNVELDWLQYGIAETLTKDLQQNPYLNVVNAFTNAEWGFFSRLLRAGYEDGLGAPLGLQREIADNHNYQYFVNGVFQQNGGQYALTAYLYRTEGQELVGEFSVNGNDVMALIDELSVEIKADLEVPAGGGRLADDMSVQEQYTNSFIALSHYIDALKVRLLGNDYEQALEQLDIALDKDPSFALAGLFKTDLLAGQGRAQEATQAAQQAETHGYKLGGLDRDFLKAIIYSLKGEQDKNNQVLKMRVELSPNDTKALWRLADNYKWQGKLDEALVGYAQILELDASDSRVLRELSILHQAKGDNVKAVEYALQYNQKRPDDMSGALRLGSLYHNNGARALARQEFERAQLLRSGVVSPLIMLAGLEARSGDSPTAQKHLDEAESIANSPQQYSLVLQEKILLLERQGRINEALDLLDQRKAYEQQFNTPINILFEVDMGIIGSQLAIRKYDEARELLAAGEAQLQAPYDQFLQIAYAFMHTFTGDHDAAELSISRSDAIVDQFALDHVRFQVDYAKAVLAHDKKEYALAAQHFQDTIDRILGSVVVDNLPHVLANLYASLAREKTFSRSFGEAAAALERGFQLDEGSAELWMERARLQWQKQQTELARASMNYALAIWDNADPEYYAYQNAKKLAETMGIGVTTTNE